MSVATERRPPQGRVHAQRDVSSSEGVHFNMLDPKIAARATRQAHLKCNTGGSLGVCIYGCGSSTAKIILKIPVHAMGISRTKVIK